MTHEEDREATLPHVASCSGGGSPTASFGGRRARLGGLALIIGERQQQLERWSAEHDDRHVRGDLVEAAQQLLTEVQDDLERTPAGVADWGLVERHPDPIERLALAGALIAAEIDRRLRCEHRELDADRLRAEAGDFEDEPGESYWIVDGTCDAFRGLSSAVQFFPGTEIPCVGELEWGFVRDGLGGATRFGSREEAEGAIACMFPAWSQFLSERPDGERLVQLPIRSVYTFRALEIRKGAPVAQTEPLSPNLAHGVRIGQGEWVHDGDCDGVFEDSYSKLWEALNRYAEACGGATGADTLSGARMDAFVDVEDAVRERIQAEGNMVAGRKLFLVQDVDRPMHIVAHDWQAAIAAWKRVVVDCGAAEEFQEPAGVQLVCGAEDLLIEGKEVDRG